MKTFMFILTLLLMPLPVTQKSSLPSTEAKYYVLTITSEAPVTFQATYVVGGRPPVYNHLDGRTPFADTLFGESAYVIIHKLEGEGPLSAQLESPSGRAGEGSGTSTTDIVLVSGTHIGSFVTAF